MNQRTPRPLLIVPGKPARALERLPRVHKEFDEGFLQKLLAEHPELLPVRELRDEIGSLLCIGREVTVASGSIDNLYLSTAGYPVVVETKLWRNPQARREVLSQTLDYIKEIVRKDFEWFEEQWQRFRGKDGPDQGSFFECLAELAGDEIDEQYFVDRVNRALTRGDIISLIVGDGIETRLQELVDHLCRDTPHLRYSLGLVEMACYEDGEGGGIFVVPRVIQQVEPVERAYVRVDLAEELEGQVKVTPVATSDHVRRRGGGRVTLDEEELLRLVEEKAGRECRDRIEGFYSDLVDSFDLELEFRGAAVMLKIPHPDGEAPAASVFAFEKEGRVYNTRFLTGRLKKWGIEERKANRIAAEFWTALNAIDSRFAINGTSHVSSGSFIPFTELTDHLSEIRDLIGNVVVSAREACAASG